MADGTCALVARAGRGKWVERHDSSHHLGLTKTEVGTLSQPRGACKISQETQHFSTAAEILSGQPRT
jgi:hypothetical protein